MKLFLTSAAGVSLLCCACTQPTSGSYTSALGHTLVVGSYSAPGDSALKVYSFDPDSASVDLLCALPVANASYAAFAGPDLVYALCESTENESSVSAIRLDAGRHSAETLSVRPTGSASPCYIAISPDGRFAVTANYTGGDIAIFPIKDDGQIGRRLSLTAFEGSGPVKGRQDSSHPHCIAFTPDGRYLLVDDLGSDRIWQFAVKSDSDSLIASVPEKSVELEPGSGPRHIVFNKKGDMAYLINELSDKVTELRYDGQSLCPVQYIAADTAGAGGAGDIHLSPDGKRLYASLRLKHDGIARFDVDQSTGLLTYIGHTDTGTHPRNFTFSPDGRFLLAACRDDNSVWIFEIDTESGALRDTGHRINQEKAVFVRFI